LFNLPSRAPTAAPYPFEIQNTTRLMRFGLLALLCDTSRLLRDSFHNNSLSPLILKTCPYTSKVFRLVNYNLFSFGFVGVVWESAAPPVFGLTDWLCPYPCSRDSSLPTFSISPTLAVRAVLSERKNVACLNGLNTNVEREYVGIFPFLALRLTIL
jgi:hypothetical protein